MCRACGIYIIMSIISVIIITGRAISIIRTRSCTGYIIIIHRVETAEVSAWQEREM